MYKLETNTHVCTSPVICCYVRLYERYFPACNKSTQDCCNTKRLPVRGFTSNSCSSVHLILPVGGSANNIVKKGEGVATY
jgi:hypothetical protein